MNDSQKKITEVCDQVKNMLLEKNMKYGDSALNPIRILSKSSPIEQILVRIDDKLNRIKQGLSGILDDEDVLKDLIGYFVLLKIAAENDKEIHFNIDEDKSFTKLSKEDFDDLWDELDKERYTNYDEHVKHNVPHFRH